ncbi:chemotaxis protein CheC [Halobacillus sp. ACCC02827]|uniref:chemotaxis protein CheC n=1 Tax=Bacillaceae TaxID=186817 RepID=UPI0002A52029|nr:MULTISPECIES: chemotaxis protein CheC [Bacillaceae]ELK44766.1 chemotactic methyltransferase inhibitor [Halobacillus sp. BAB-2008]QHT46678.1 chemotaxis protein CheC [Bacillus sp. SB49]WJE17489.1 chemotaxis protein CheC [Halobacillus sp. ACCC02827]
MEDSFSYTKAHIDVWREIGTIGAGHAATALSRLLGRGFDMHVPDVHAAGFDEVLKLAGGSEEEVVGVCLQIHGDASGYMFFLFSPKQAAMFADHLTFAAGQSYRNDPTLAVSAVKELGNILSGSYLAALNQMTALTMYPSIPSLSKDMAGAVLSEGLVRIAVDRDTALVIETVLVDREKAESMKGHIFFFPDPVSYDRIFKSLGIQADG